MTFAALGAATVFACSSFDAGTGASTDAGADADADADTSAPDVAVIDASPTDAEADAAPIEAGSCMDTCNSRHCESDGGCDPLVFLTGTKTNGRFGGITGGDMICNTEAADAGLKQDFVAVLSDSNTTAVTRITGASAPPRSVWQADGTQIATNAAHMFDPNLPFLNGISNTATGAVVPSTDFAWTGTGSGGGTTGLNQQCQDWSVGDNSRSGTIGHPTTATNEWIDLQNDTCDTSLRIYCFEVTR